jgi:single-strand DNA-binding protein
MNSLNSILLEGNLTRAPEVRQLPRGSTVCQFSVASNRFYKSGENLEKEVSFFDVETWSGLAERCAGELDKGRGVRVVGRLKQERWVDQEGHNRSKIKIVADHVEFKPVFSREQGGPEDGTGPGLVDTNDMGDNGEEDESPI